MFFCFFPPVCKLIGRYLIRYMFCSTSCGGSYLCTRGPSFFPLVGVLCCRPFTTVHINFFFANIKVTVWIIILECFTFCTINCSVFICFTSGTEHFLMRVPDFTVYSIYLTVFRKHGVKVPKISAYSWWNCQATHNRLQIEINYYPDSLLFISAGFLHRVSSQRLN